MKAYCVRDIKPETYKKLRIKAATLEISINKAILRAIDNFVKNLKRNE